MDEIDNETRADWAREAIMAMAELTGQGHDGELDNADMEEVVGDLLCNLHHLADQEGLNWSKLIDHADMHYITEAEDDDA